MPRIIKNKSSIKKVKEKLPEPIIINDNFIKVNSLDGGIDYLPLVDIRYPSILQYYKNPEKPDKRNTVWRLSYILYNGAEYTDKTEYKSSSSAEKAMNNIIFKLPKMISINHITQNIMPNSENESIIEEEPKQAIGFQLNSGEDTYDE